MAVLYLGPEGPGPPPPKKNNTGQLDTVVLLLVDVIGSRPIVISLSRCCLPNDEGPGPPNIFFLEPPWLDVLLCFEYEIVFARHHWLNHCTKVYSARPNGM